MRIRLKLLILLLVIALVPVATVTWFELRSTRTLGMELADRARQVLEERGARQMLLSARAAAELVLRERKLLETAARLQGQAIEAALAARGASGSVDRVISDPGRIRAGQALAGIPVDFERMAVILPPGGSRRTLSRLNGLVPQLAELRREFAPYALWQRILLDDGRLGAVYPAHARALTDEARADWMRRVTEVVALPPAPDPWSKLPVLTVAVPLRAPSGQIIGATAIDAPLEPVIGRTAEQSFEPARTLVVRPDGGDIQVIAERDGGWAGGGAVFGGPAFAAVLSDMAEGRAGVRRVAQAGEEAFWAYAPIDDFQTNLLFVVPYHEVVADALTARDYLFGQLADQRAVLWFGLLVFVPLLIGLALFASRAVTRPVNQLAEAARELADGNFNARTSIRSGDELEELGLLFNEMVPQLEASMRMRDSLDLAQEVQQHLLPREAPRVPGFDIHGVSLYCDETGGDYFDFMPLPALGPGAVAVMIGDVAGHGIAAALLMTTARALLRAREPRPGALAEQVGAVNRHLCRDAHAGRFMTLFLAVLDADAQRINWVGAGHGSGFIFDPAAEAFLEISGPDIPLGVDAAWRYEELGHTGWSPGTVMLVGTDGIWETRNPEGAMFGKAAVRRVIRANADRPAAEIAAELIRALAEFRGGGPQVDDVTMIVMKAV